MSKSRNNVVNPDDVVDRIRRRRSENVHFIYRRLRKSAVESDAIKGCQRFLE